MRCAWKIVTHPIATLRTVTFITVLTLASLVPMLSNPSIANADSVVQPGTDWLSNGGVDIMTGGDGSHNCLSVSGAPGQSQCGNTAGKVYSGDKWQCVEMVNRLYLTKGWTTTTWWGNGNSLINDLSNHAGLTDQLQDHVSYVNTGDVVTETHSTDGHAGIINTIDANGTIHIKSQNADLDSQASITSGSLAANNAHYALSGWVGYAVQAIVHHPSSSGTSTPSTPVAVSRDSSNMAVFYNDGNSNLVNWSWNSGTSWAKQQWADSGGLFGQPAVISRDSGSMDVFYTTGQHKLVNKSWSSSGNWTGPTVLLGSDVAGDPAVVARDASHMQVFYRTLEGDIKSIAWDAGTSWNTNPQLLYSSAATTDPTAISRNSNSMEVFFGKNNGRLVHLGWSSGSSWGTDDFSAGAGVIGKPTAITRNSGGNMSAYYQESGNGKVAEEAWNWQTSWGWQDWTASLAGSPSAIAGISNVIDNFYRETGGNIVDRYFTGSAWQTTNVVGSGGATGNPYAITRGTTDEEVFYWNGPSLMDANWNTSRQSWSVGQVQ